MAEEEALDADTLRILVATDSHIGFNGKDKMRGSDALNTFEEVLQIARVKHADCMLHGGDLFHENKPQRSCLYQTMDLLRRYCFGPGDVKFQVVSDPSLFSRGLINYEDPNTNVEMPVFMIHGNHDDPGGDSNLCAGNLLEVAGLVNYFGRSEDLEDIVIRPVLLRKGITQVAVYGLGNIRDERLNRAFQNRKVRFETPANPEQWFNIMILHQNRHKGNKGGVPTKACIHEQMLPTFLDLVIWGHEHECEVTPVESLRGEFYVVQPGSSVATSLIQAETALKHVAVIDVRAGCFRCSPVPLWTVRPLVMDDLVLSEIGLLRTDTQAIWNSLTERIEALLARGDEECKRRRRELSARGAVPALEVPVLPLVRLRVEHSGFETVSSHTFGQQFVERMANPYEVLQFHRRAGTGGTGEKRGSGPVADILEIDAGPENVADGINIQDIIYKYIDGDNLQILSEPDLNDAVQSFVHRAEPCAIERFVREQVEATNHAVLRESRAVGEEEIRVQIQDRAENMRQRRLAGAEDPAAAGGGGAGAAAGGAAAAAAGAAAGAAANGAAAAAAGAAAPRRGPSREDPFGAPVNVGGSQAKVEHIDLDDGPAAGEPPAFARDPIEATPPVGGRGSRGGGRGAGRGRGRGRKRDSAAAEQDMMDFGAPANKAPRLAAAAPAGIARASGAAAMPQPAARRLPDVFFNGGGGAAAPPGGPQAAEGGPPAAAPPAAVAAAATPFLQKRGGNTAEAAWGVDIGGEAANNSQRLSQPTTKRGWVLRGQP